MKSSSDIRKAFLDFFAGKGHEVVASSPLVPGNDPTLLFTNAGMVQFKDVFLGSDKRPYSRATSVQRCVRAGGKHNDLENVGYTARHHTFFEMLGNFSFGDYFKQDAIKFAWEFLTETCGLPAEKLWVTVYEEDDEAADIWLKEVGVDPNRFTRIGDKPGKKFDSDNFWSMGDTGPCGPCTEIFYDHGEAIWGGPPGSPEEDGDRYIEIWNLVFMQYDRDKDGNMKPLPKPSVDTGMGLERLAAVMQNVHSNYEIDLFQNLIKAAAKLAGTEDLENASLKVIADHIRSCAFLVTDGVIPSNEGRGYVLRRIIRRAIRHGHKLGINDSFFHKLVGPLADEMGEAYPELKKAQGRVASVLKREEERFLETIDIGMRMLSTAISTENYALRWLEDQKPGWKLTGLNVSSFGGMSYAFNGLMEHNGEEVPVEVVDGTDLSQQKLDEIYQLLYACKEDVFTEFKQLVVVIYWKDGKLEIPKEIQSVIAGSEFPAEVVQVTEKELKSYRTLPGHMAFKLHDTYGFPLDLTQDVCREHGVTVDVEGFEKEMAEQRERARGASHFAQIDMSVSTRLDAEGTVLKSTEFTGYEKLSDSSQVVALYSDGKPVEELAEGERGMVVLDKTPFYAESGGQAGDCGRITAEGMVFEVQDTKKQGEAFVHLGLLTHGSLKTGSTVQAEVDPLLRQNTAYNHSATHLLHAALRKVLGEHVQQKGSLVSAERLRFDFSHFEAVTDEQLATIENMVNEKIRANLPVDTRIMAIDEAKSAGAMALFGEKYGEKVRVLSMGDFSIELCGGTHVSRTGDIGLMKIVSETGTAAGVRRIEAVTGQGALDWITAQEERLERVAEVVKSGRDDVADKVQQLFDRSRKLEKELEQLKAKLASSQGSDLASQAEDINGIKVLAANLEGADPKGLRDIVDQLKNKLGTAAVIVATVEGEKISLVAGVTKDATDRLKAGDLLKSVAEQVGGKGGGRPDMAQGGGSQPENLQTALESVSGWVRTQIGG